MTDDEVLDAAMRWTEIDPDPRTRAELLAVIERARHDPLAMAELHALMDHRLTFGTAGLRGEMGPGRNRINRLMARQTAWGIGRTLLDERAVGEADRQQTPQRGADSDPPLILVGHDARHHSEEFALDIVAVLEALGVRCTLVLGPNPTPLMSWGLRRIEADAGIVVTASHNPAADNGIKIFWGDGAQIVSPTDELIAEAIRTVADVDPSGSVDAPTPADTSLADEYVAFVTGLVTTSGESRSTHSANTDRANLRIAYTAMHGVGAPLLHRCFDAAGFSDVHVVAAQEQPDPDFPTVAFPNPEEPGATDLLLELAARIDADVAFANDPDADRLAMAIRRRSTNDSGRPDWRMLTGDELGWLFAAGLIEFGDPTVPSLLATTVVSSQLLSRIAEAHGIAFFETLTGFKWVSRPGIASPDLVQMLAYEEALGYALGGARDKDGISAAVVMADLLTMWKRQGTGPEDVLDRLAVAHGAHVQHNFSVRFDGDDWMQRLVQVAERVVEAPPRSLGGVAVQVVEQPAADVIRLSLANADRVVVRPSGTEPKMKCYCEAVEPVAPGESPDAARARAAARLADIVTDLRSQL